MNNETYRHYPGPTLAHTSGASPVQARLGKGFTLQTMDLTMGRMAYSFSPKLRGSYSVNLRFSDSLTCRHFHTISSALVGRLMSIDRAYSFCTARLLMPDTNPIPSYAADRALTPRTPHLELHRIRGYFSFQ